MEFSEQHLVREKVGLAGATLLTAGLVETVFTMRYALDPPHWPVAWSSLVVASLVVVVTGWRVLRLRGYAMALVGAGLAMAIPLLGVVYELLFDSQLLFDRLFGELPWILLTVFGTMACGIAFSAMRDPMVRRVFAESD